MLLLVGKQWAKVSNKWNAIENISLWKMKPLKCQKLQFSLLKLAAAVSVYRLVPVLQCPPKQDEWSPLSDFSHHINFTLNLLVWTLLSLKVTAAAAVSYRWTGLCLCSRQTICLAVGYTPSSTQFCFISMWLWIFISKKKSLKTIKKSKYKYFDVVQYLSILMQTLFDVQ